MIDETGQAPKLKPVETLFRKADDVPMYHVDGGWSLASSDPQQIVIKFFLEHTPVPKQITHPLTPDGSSVSPVPDSILSEDDSLHFTIVREFQAGIVMPISGARRLHQLLGTVIANHDKLRQRQQQQSRL